ncbi:MAG TPA: 2Fe-2S iron-sulfur cluster-binding protein, partial [Nitrococcus sp.]|nr:2Fe-2S iron-sulfur cluster-binding protein [Nitrococcus sp.]
MNRSNNECRIIVDGHELQGMAGEPLIACLERNQIELPHLCYHPALGPLQTCDTCWVYADGGLVRACTLKVTDGMRIGLETDTARQARGEGMDRILAKHELYCTVCENNTGDCQLHNTVASMGIPIQRYPFQRKPYEKDTS